MGGPVSYFDHVKCHHCGAMLDPDKLSAVGRMGGLAYCRTQERFEMPFGRKAIEP